MDSHAGSRGNIEQGALLRTLINSLPDLVWLKDVNGVYLACNARFERFFGAEEKHIVGKTDYDFVGKALADFFREHDRMAMEKNEASANEEWVTFADDGHSELLETIKTPMRDNSGRLIGVLGIGREITARKKTEAALAESESRYRTLVENSPFCIHEIDLQGRLQSMNLAGLKMLGLDDETKIRGAPYLGAVSEQDNARIKSLLEEAINGSASHFEFAAAGEIPLYFKSCFIPIKDVGGKVIKLMGLTEDITERRRMEDALYFVAQRGWQDRSENFFDALAQYLGKSLGVDYVIIDRLGDDPLIAETIALFAKGAIVPNIRYSLKGTPCENVMGGDFCCYQQGVQRLFPDDALLAEMGVESYTGVPLWDSSGQALGLIAVLDSKPLPDGEAFDKLLRIVATRAAAELERKLSDDRLHEQKEFLGSMFDNALDAVIVMDAAGIITAWSNQAEKIFGWSHEEAVGRLMHETIVPVPYRERHLRGMEHFLSTGEGPLLNKRIEISALHRDGREFPVELSISPIKTAAGYQFSIFARDISVSKQAEAALRESEEKLRTLYELSPLGIALTDMSGRYVEFNESFRRICGYPEEELKQLDYWALTPKKYEADEARQLESLTSTGRYGPYEKEYMRKDGTLVPLSLNGVLVKGSDGRDFIWSIVEDITESKRLQQQLAEREELFRAIIEQSPNAVELVDLDTLRFFEVNHAACLMMGYSHDEYLQLRLIDTQCDMSETELAAMVQRVKEAGSATFENRHRCKNGEILDVEVFARILPIQGKRLMVSVWRNITESKRADNALRNSLREYSELVQRIPVGVYKLKMLKEGGSVFDYVSQRWCEILDITEEEAKHEPSKVFARIHPDDMEQFYRLNGEARNALKPFEWEGRIRKKNGEIRWLHIESQPTPLENGDILWDGIQYDITARHAAEDTLRITASVFDNSQEAVIITDANNRITDVNPAFARITGYSREEVLGKDPGLLSAGRQEKAFYTAMWNALKQQKFWRGEIWNRRKSGDVYAELLSISAICNDDGEVQRYVAVFSDISHIKEHEAELSRVAYYDALTGIPNRLLLVDRMRQAIAQASREQNLTAVCYLDLDGFKQVNDSLGHDAGDQVLIEVAKRIAATIRGGDTVARLGGDEFVVLLLGLERSDECLTTLERLLAAIAEPLVIGSARLALSVSIGVSIYPLDDEDPDTLLRHADQAMYVAKQSGKNRYHIFDPSLNLRARSQLEFQQQVSDGLARGQFELFYQPKVNLRTKQLAGAEALIRWRHPERGLLIPTEFLRLIEKTDTDIALGEWVIASALAQIDRWHRLGMDIEISVNISAYHLESAGFAENLEKQITRFPAMPHERLQIEMLETVALSDFGIVSKIIDTCRGFGVRFALDDFGTGYSSLSYLSNLPIDVLKVDQTFVRDMLQDKGDMAIVQGIIALAKSFGRQVVAEGIESGEQYRALLDLGCEIGQGYAIASPMTADELLRWKFD